jgi:hypothetical protein
MTETPAALEMDFWAGFLGQDFFDGGAKLTTVSHLKQEYTSSRGRSSFDLLPIIATPQTGQC